MLAQRIANSTLDEDSIIENEHAFNYRVDRVAASLPRYMQQILTWLWMAAVLDAKLASLAARWHTHGTRRMLHKFQHTHCSTMAFKHTENLYLSEIACIIIFF